MEIRKRQSGRSSVTNKRLQHFGFMISFCVRQNPESVDRLSVVFDPERVLESRGTFSVFAGFSSHAARSHVLTSRVWHRLTFLQGLSNSSASEPAGAGFQGRTQLREHTDPIPLPGRPRAVPGLP